jgi:hypothetical protein
MLSALSTRIGIMAQGSLRCVGTAAHLKAKYGRGYNLTLNMLATDHPVAQAETISEFVRDTLLGQPVSDINRTKKFLIPTSSFSSISEIFKQMELNKQRLEIREWGLTMSTLEEVFISAVTSQNHTSQ